jgi:hypothetical protein
VEEASRLRKQNADYILKQTIDDFRSRMESNERMAILKRRRVEALSAIRNATEPMFLTSMFALAIGQAWAPCLS